jgi:hypothetical protein
MYKHFGETIIRVQEVSQMVESSMQLREENVEMGLCMN